MFKKLSLRIKLALIALGPLLALLVLSFLQVNAGMGDSTSASDAQADATVSALTGQLFDSYRLEAVENQVVAAGGAQGDARSDTDAAVQRWLDGAGENAGLTLLDGEAGLAAFLINDLDGHRSSVDNSQDAGAVVALDLAVLERIERYDGLLAARTTGTEALDSAADLTTVSADAAALQLTGLWATGSGVAPAELASTAGAALASAESFGIRNAADLPAAPGAYTQLVNEFGSLSTGDAVTMSIDDWRSASDARADQLAELRAGTVVSASQEASALSGGADSGLRNAGLLFLLGLISSLAAIFFVYRLLSRGFDALSDQATGVADSDLPRIAASLRDGGPAVDFEQEQPLEAVGGKEFDKVSDSIGSIRNSASDLGVQVGELQSGISDTFVNLARRNQSLVDRQLEAIDTLEAEERDPDRLALMYRVDHLATRMRRNAESLLVLADAKTPERHSPPVELREVLRVAIGEVEDYRRVVPISLDPINVPGHRAQDVAHLLAELMENAAQHSPPGSAVDVSGAFETASQDYVITVVDHGTGIAEDQLSGLNTMLATPPTSTMTISHSIGLQVISRLAHSIGLQVQLATGADNGVIATVRVPAALASEWGVPEGAAPASPSVPDLPNTIGVGAAPAALAPAVTPAPEPVVTPAPEPVVPAPLAPVADLAPPSLDAGGVELPSTPEPAPVVEMPGLDLPSLGDPSLQAPSADVTSIPDMAIPDMAIPDIATPGTSIPDLAMPESAPEIDLPEVFTPEASLEAAAPEVFTPEVFTPEPALDAAAPEVFTPEVFTPEASLDAAAPEVFTPDVAIPDIAAPAAQDGSPVIPDMSIPDVATPDVALPVDVPGAALPDMAIPDVGLPEAAPVVPETPADPFAATGVADLGAPAVPDVAAAPAPVVPEVPPVAEAPAAPDIAAAAPAPVAPAPVAPAPVAPAVTDPALTQSFPSVTPDLPPTPVAPEAPAPVAPAAQAPAPAPVAPPVNPVPEAPGAMAPPAAPAPAPVVPIVAPAPQAPAPQAPAPAPAATPPAAAAAPVAQPNPTQTPSAPPAADVAPKTSAGLTRRKRSEPTEAADLNAVRTAPSQRSPDQVKNMLSRYKSGLQRGRTTPETDGES